MNGAIAPAVKEERIAGKSRIIKWRREMREKSRPIDGVGPGLGGGAVVASEW
jgi:hypothetical protein